MTKTGTCDGCRAGADTDVYLQDGRLLELCDRHARRHQSALQREGALVIGRLLAGQAPAATPYEGVAFEREFRRLALAATDRTSKRLTASAFLRPPEQQDKVESVTSGWLRTWTRWWGRVSRPRPPAND
jgi:hypothetical protein